MRWSDVINDECSDGSTVIGGSDSAEAFLTDSLPNLSFDIFIVDEHALMVAFEYVLNMLRA